MDKAAVRKVIYSRIEELPTLPAVLPKVLSLVESEKSSAADIAEVIHKDPALAAKILKVANSAYYGYSREVTAIQMAVGLLGLNMVRSLVISIGVLQGLPPGQKRAHFRPKGLWKHSLAAAAILQEMRTISGNGRTSLDHFFIVGLLHDVGKVVLDQFFSDLFQDILEETAATGSACLHEMERKRLGLDHGEIGAMLLSRWRFPEVIIKIILYHHRPGPLPGDIAREAAMLRLADMLAYQSGFGDAGNPAPPEVTPEEYKLVNFNWKQMDRLTSRLEDVEVGVEAFYSAIF